MAELAPIATLLGNGMIAGAMLWWLTAKLIPTLQIERDRAIASFVEELKAERASREKAIQVIIELTMSIENLSKEFSRHISWSHEAVKGLHDRIKSAGPT